MKKKLIEINLSSEFEKLQIKKSNQVKIPLHTGLLICVGILAIGIIYLFIFFSNQSYMKLKANYDIISKDIKLSKHYIETNKYLKTQLIKIGEWHSNRIDWSAEWKKLGILIPEEVYLDGIDARGIDPNDDAILLTLSGRAFGPSGESAILEFVEKLRYDPSFKKDYDVIKMGSIISEKNEKRFSIELIHNKSSKK